MKGFLTEFTIGESRIGAGEPPLLIAETACAHDGSPEEAMRLVDASVEAGADLVQLQVFRAAEQVPPSHSIRPLLEKLELSDSEWREVFEHARSKAKGVMAFVYDVPSLQVALNHDVVALKLNSADLLNRPLLEGCAKSKLPLFLGTGASTFDEISQSLAFLSECGAEKVILMHGVQDFPTKLSDARIDRVRILNEIFNLPSGYGDHTDGREPISRNIDLVALGLGASALEKHITLDRSEEKPDFQAALEPADWKTWASTMREAAEAFSVTPPVDLGAADERYRIFQKKFAVVTRRVSEGEKLDTSLIRFLRLEEKGEISALAWEKLGPVVAKRDIEAWEPVRSSDLSSARDDSDLD